MAGFRITTVDPLTFDSPRGDALVAEVGHPDETFYVKLISRDPTRAHERALALQGRRVRITIETLDDPVDPEG